MAEHEADPETSIEHLDWHSEVEDFVEPELSRDKLLPLVNVLMHRLDTEESREQMLAGQGGWDALERQIGSHYMKKIFGNRKENE